MAKPLIFGKKLVLVERDTTEREDPAPTTAANALLCESVVVTPEVQIIDRIGLKPHIGRLPSIRGSYNAAWELTFEWKGGGLSGADVAIPDWDPIFGGSIYKRTDVGAPVTSRVYRPHTPGVAAGAGETIETSFTMYVYQDGVRWRLTACRGDVEINMPAGDRAMATAKGFGLLSVDVAGVESQRIIDDTAFPTSATFDATLPAPCLALAFTVDGFAHKGSALKFGLGADLKKRVNFQRLTGFEGFFHAGRNPVATVDPELELVATEDFFAALMTSRQMALAGTYNAGGAAGQVITISAPIVQYVSYAETERDGALALSLGLGLRQSSGDDELVLTVA